MNTQKKIIIIYCYVFVTFILGVGHWLSWGNWALKMPFLQLGNAVGVLSLEGVQEIKQACLTLNKWSCVQSTSLQIYRSTGDKNELLSLARIQYRVGDKAGAAGTYQDYFASVKTEAQEPEADAAYSYAKILEELNQLDQALNYYRQASVAARSTMPVNSISAMVRILVKQKKYNEAKVLVENFRRKESSAGSYLQAELKMLQKVTNPSRTIKFARQ